MGFLHSDVHSHSSKRSESVDSSNVNVRWSRRNPPVNCGAEGYGCSPVWAQEREAVFKAFGGSSFLRAHRPPPTSPRSSSVKGLAGWNRESGTIAPILCASVWSKSSVLAAKPHFFLNHNNIFYESLQRFLLLPVWFMKVKKAGYEFKCLDLWLRLILLCKLCSSQIFCFLNTSQLIYPT